MAWTKSSPELIAAFGAALPDDPRLQRRKMFGFEAAFANGYMLGGLFEEQLHVRLPQAALNQALALPGAQPFSPMAGRPMKEYVCLPPAVIADPASLKAWLVQAFEYACARPPKTAGKRAGSPSKTRKKAR
jgi:TfoX/Sxy family transcriptional regulator of competence genes